MHKRIYITTSFIGFHRWKGAPPEFGYLRHIHRHVFQVRLELVVTESNREIEFINFKDRVDDAICVIAAQRYSPEWETATDPTDLFNSLEWSCEHWCEFLLEKFPEVARAEVSEDGENGAYITRGIDPKKAAENFEDAVVKEMRRQQRVSGVLEDRGGGI